MQSHLHAWRHFYRRRPLSLILGYICLPLVLAALLFSSGLGSHMLTAFAHTSCSSSASTSNTTTCVSTTALDTASYNTPAKGHYNPFPRGSCTWWADQRYFQLHGFYVPWTTRANAWQWTARARDFRWKVSMQPSRGSIIDLQPWVQWAWGSGHVAIVEKVLANGHVITSNMDWWPTPWRVTSVEFKPGLGVTFISY